ncbi:MAG: M61 family metallopeptidase [Betaproteobacteria bacterium]|nr:M61 family metallopeptidase [Betaproteobacteria bacterium]
MNPIRYRIDPKDPTAHLFEVSCTVDDPDPAGQRFALPAWIPGSYLIREFARNIVTVRGESDGKPVALEKLDKHTWRAAPARKPLTVICEVYAGDPAVRGAHLDTTHGFFNGTSVFLRAPGREDRPCAVEILPPAGDGYQRWRVATTLPRAGAAAWGFGAYRAKDYAELIDHPVEMGEFAVASFRACGVPHDLVITGRHRADAERLQRDLKTLCEAHIRFFGEPAPMARYLFLATVVDEGHGGLEHRASCALLLSRDDLPAPGEKKVSEGYRSFLRLCSHEYFHTWNVTRIRPRVFAPHDLDRENYTRQLWAFEGMTSYYGDLLLARSGLVSPAAYLEMLGQTVTKLLRAGGRHRQTVEEASFDAWIKFYRADENAPNALVSYYTKGELVALALDLMIRRRSGGKRSLDDVMRALWERHGKPGIPLEEGEVERVAAEVSGIRLAAFFSDALRGTGDLPLPQLLRSVGVACRVRPAESAEDKGGKPSARSAAALARRATLGARTAVRGGDLRLTHVLDGGTARGAGLAAGDTLLALDGIRVTPKNLERLLRRYRPGDSAQLHFFRRDELMAATLVFKAPELDTCVLAFRENPGRAVLERRKAWLEGS